jgi:hypothetical protein
MKTLLSVCLLLVAPALYAGEISKCVDAKGNLSFMDEPCPVGSTNAAAKPAPKQTVQARPQQQQQQQPSTSVPSVPAPYRPIPGSLQQESPEPAQDARPE